MNSKKLSFCQVSLARDIPIIKQNYESLKEFYKDIEINVICPKSELDIFKKNLNFKEFVFFDEEEILSFKEFYKVFDKLIAHSYFKDKMSDRLHWYYQQLLKITFVVNYIKQKKEEIIIWDADTIITKKINFFNNLESIKYATLFEYHKPYFLTVKSIFGYLPKYYISSLIQFTSITKNECDFFLRLLKIHNVQNKDMAIKLSSIILKNVNENHEIYSSSLFSEYELIGISKILNNKTKQKAIFTLRSGLSGQLTKNQFLIAKILNVYHITYEHSHSNNNSRDMLKRKQNWFLFIKLLIKFYPRFLIKNIIYNFKYFFINI